MAITESWANSSVMDAELALVMMAQRLARLAEDREVPGSSPARD